MHILIVGAGLAGLSTALALTHPSSRHQIVLLESAPALAEIGAGIQLTPVATRQLKAWGLQPQLLASSALPQAWNLRRGSDGQVLNRVPIDKFEQWYGAPYVVVHRADLHKILHEAVVTRGVEVRLNSRVERYGVEGGWVELSTGEILQADLVIACDGINSTARTQLLKNLESGIRKHEELEPTPWAAYRLTADVNDIRNDSLTKEIVDEHCANCWAGSNRLMMTYLMKDSGTLNLVLTHPDDKDTSNWTREEYVTELRQWCNELDPRVHRLIDLSTGPVTNWPVHQVTTLPSWMSRHGRFVLIGDAAHAMAFYLSMGVSLAIEDAAALKTALDIHVSNPETFSLIDAVSLFQKVRKPRAEKIRDASLHAGIMLHLPPGTERDLRDQSAMNDCAVAEAQKGDALLEWISYGITDQHIRQECYGYDIVSAIRLEAEKD